MQRILAIAKKLELTPETIEFTRPVDGIGRVKLLIRGEGGRPFIKDIIENIKSVGWANSIVVTRQNTVSSPFSLTIIKNVSGKDMRWLETRARWLNKLTNKSYYQQLSDGHAQLLQQLPLPEKTRGRNIKFALERDAAGRPGVTFTNSAIKFIESAISIAERNRNFKYNALKNIVGNSHMITATRYAFK